uniref:NADH dehydrogenase subunit 4 n=1 Tax=Ixodes ornithorhynchi TaxID=85878 RepID=UPI00286B739C|nr:NADH dehydrogenase subunit 4 [Ixodes ornithorhynchi]WKW95246.1 NADH dehydrogenase subunit 4 [Ixodes ornithorhynchi]WKW95259.1 NADH dehydrogenase subunit 4 [Ixodes ornithorhynchi]
MLLLMMCMVFWLSGLDLMIMLISFFFFFFFFCFMKGSFMYDNMILGGDLMSFCLMMLTIWVIYLMMMSSFLNSLFENKMFMLYLVMMMFFLFMCFFSLSLLMFYFFFESVLFPIIMIIFNWGNQPERLQAGIYMFLYTLFGSYPLLTLMLFFGEDSLNYFYLYMMSVNIQVGYFFYFMILGFLVKVPMFFVHLWLPKAHVEAPISGSMILAAVLLKLGIYGLYRFSVFFMGELMKLGVLVMVISVMGGMIVSIMCFFQVDIKSLIAYSSVCHMGIVLGGVMSMNFWSSYGSMLLMIGHGLCSSSLFCLANFMYERFYTRSMLMLKGVGKLFPNLGFWWFVMSISNMSAPLTMNLLGEVLLMGGLMKMSMFFVFPLMVISFVSAGYSLYMFSYIYHGDGWTIFSVKMIEMREYMVMMFHFFPMIIWVMKMECFSNWF